MVGVARRRVDVALDLVVDLRSGRDRGVVAALVGVGSVLGTAGSVARGAVLVVNGSATDSTLSASAGGIRMPPQPDPVSPTKRARSR